MAAVTVDWTDPCARLAELRSAYYAAVGGGARRVRFQNGDTIQEVEYGAVDLAVLKVEMERARVECEAKNGLLGRPQRFAIQVGAARRGRHHIVGPGESA